MKGASKLLTGTLLLAVIIAIGAGVFYYLSQGVEETHIERFTITGISSVSVDSFAIDGTLVVENPSNLIVPIKSIEYDVILEDTGERIGSGELPSFTLETGLTEIPFQQQVMWQPTTSVATDLLLDGESTITVEGTIHILLPDDNTFSLDFSDETEITEFVTQHTSQEQIELLELQQAENEQRAEGFEQTLVENIPGRIN